MIETVMRIGAFLKRWAAKVGPSQAGWTGAAWGTFALSLLVVGVLFYFEVIAYFWSGRLQAFAIILGVFVAFPLALNLTYGLLSTLPLRFRLAVFTAFLPLGFFSMAVWGPPKGLLPPVLIIVSVALLFGSLTSLRSLSGFSIRALKPLGFGLLGLGTLGFGFMQLTKTQEDPNSWMADVPPSVHSLNLPNPGVPGDRTVTAFTYGSGKDLHRPEFGEDVTYKTKSVDGSNLVDKWSGPVGKVRTRFWGFDAEALPVNGRVWMPQSEEEGEGPFPLVLIVHGNHGMEDFSDPGYEYLGRHFASRGIITVSVDENFLNSSNADLVNPMNPGIGRENDARGWMMLKHLEQWRAWSRDPDHPLSSKVDMSKLGLIGHSRGGEAVAIAAAFNDLPVYPDNAAETFDFGFDLSGIIAIAPADGQYRPRNAMTPLEDVNYFVIHGSMDGDVQSFMGASQFSRIAYSGEKDAFKASLYVAGANHGQFNTSWGNHDFGLPFSWLLNLRDIMDPEEQRQIAVVSFTAFLETVFDRGTDYRPFLEDVRRGADWLPQTYMISNLQSSSRIMLADFEEDLDLTTGARPDIEIRTGGLTKWREEAPSLKWNSLDTNVAVVAWDKEVSEDAAFFEVNWTEGEPDESTKLVFVLSSLKISTKPKGWEDPEAEEEGTDEEGADKGKIEDADEEDSDEEEDKPEPLNWTLVATDALGNEARLPLSHVSALNPQVKAATRLLDDFQSIAKSEIVWQRYEFPLLDFLGDNIDFEPYLFTSFRFEFDKSEAGAFAIDDIGFE